jgi:hypothetical protein
MEVKTPKEVITGLLLGFIVTLKMGLLLQLISPAWNVPQKHVSPSILGN